MKLAEIKMNFKELINFITCRDLFLLLKSEEDRDQHSIFSKFTYKKCVYFLLTDTRTNLIYNTHSKFSAVLQNGLSDIFG